MFALVRGQVKEYLEEGIGEGLIKFHSKSNIIIIITIVKVRSPPIISNYEAVVDEEKVFFPLFRLSLFMFPDLSGGIDSLSARDGERNILMGS